MNGTRDRRDPIFRKHHHARAVARRIRDQFAAQGIHVAARVHHRVVAGDGAARLVAEARPAVEAGHAALAVAVVQEEVGVDGRRAGAVGGAFAKTSFDQDHQRFIGALAYGNIKNDYNDYLGTGVPLQNNAELRSLIVRYTYRISGDWFVGVQGIKQNFAIAGETEFDNQVLDVLGVKPYKSGGLGIVVQRDTRDSEDMPTRGSLLNLNNLAYREALGGQDNFDVYRVDIRYFMPHGNGHVFAVRQLNHLTNNAPTQTRAPVQLRGYKIGQYNSEYMSSIEGEERLRLAERWTATVFAGVACLYGQGAGGGGCAESTNLFPAAGAGVQYILKPKQGIVLNLEYARGKSGNSGVYLKMGYAY